MLASEGRHFCAGLDFAGNAGQDIAALYRAALRLFAAPLPVVAAVQGAAIGGWLRARALGRLPGGHSDRAASAPTSPRLGFHHGFALTVTLPAVVGRQAAADLLLTGRRVGGEQALALGLCDRLADDGRPAGAGHRPTRTSWPRRGRSPSAPSGPRCAADWSRRPGSAMEHEYAEQTRLRDTADFAEGVRAAAERRDPAFRGA